MDRWMNEKEGEEEEEGKEWIRERKKGLKGSNPEERRGGRRKDLKRREPGSDDEGKEMEGGRMEIRDQDGRGRESLGLEV